MTEVEIVLERVGLPVKCHVCKSRAFVKPRTDYGGWRKFKLISGATRWFCPEEAEKVERSRKNFYERYNTPEEKIDTTVSAKEELYKLLD